MNNTKKQGVIRFFIYKERKKYIGVCLDLDIVEEGKDIEKIKESLTEAVRGYIETVTKEKMDDNLLNRPAPKIYWEKYEAFLKFIAKKRATQQACASFKEASVSSACLPLHSSWGVV